MSAGIDEAADRFALVPRSLAAFVGALAIFAGGCASSVRGTCPSSQLTEQRIRDIAVAEYQRRGGVFREPYWDYHVTSENCRIFFHASHKEASAWLHFGVELDGLGNVVRYMPGE